MTGAANALANVLRQWRWRLALTQTGDAAFVALAAGGLIATAMRGMGVAALWPAAIAGISGMGALWRRPPSLAQVADRLDEHHDLSNLLGSAWATRDGAAEPWRATLMTLAADRAATLPPMRDVAKFSGRQRACGLAAVAAVWLAAGLVPRGDPSGPAMADAVAAPPRPAESATHVADVIRRQPDTADNALPESGPTETPAAGERSNRPATGDAEASGAGRADATSPHGFIPANLPSEAAPRINGVGGSGRAGRAGGDDTAARSVVVVSPTSNARRDDRRGTHTNDAHGGTTAVGVPDAYRDMVRDFFAR